MVALTPNGLYQTLAPPVGPGAPIGVNLVSEQRLTLQREANELIDQIARAHTIMDQFCPAPSVPNQPSEFLPLGQAIAASREQMARLLDRIDQLFAAIGQV